MQERVKMVMRIPRINRHQNPLVCAWLIVFDLMQLHALTFYFGHRQQA